MSKVYGRKNLSIVMGTIIILTIAVIATIFAINAYGAGTVSYKIENDWGTGSTISVTVQNTGSSSLNGWEISWTFPENQKISNMWGANFTQNGAKVTATNANWNSTIPAGGSTSFGFVLTYSGKNSIPSDITLNGSTNAGTTTNPVTTTNSVTTTSSAVRTTNPITTSNVTTSTVTTTSPVVQSPSGQITNLSQLPDLSMNPTVSQLKAWVSKTYDLFPQFKEVYENDLGMTKTEALAFHYADMSRESGKDGYWQMDLETGIGGAGHAWGPFQAAVTNFTGGGYDNDILNRLGMPTPTISQFKVPNVSTYAGMKRLAEGIEESKVQMGTNRTTVEYLLGTLAHHNTGHATLETITNAGWLESYGNETLRMMQGYIVGNHMTDDKAFWTTEPISGVTGPWSGGNK